MVIWSLYLLLSASLATTFFPEDVACSALDCMAESMTDDSSHALALLQKEMRAISYKSKHTNSLGDAELIDTGASSALALTSSIGTRRTEYALGPFVVKLEKQSNREFSLRVEDSNDGSRVLFAGMSRGNEERILAIGSGIFEYTEESGSFSVNHTTTFATVGQSLDSISYSSNELSLNGELLRDDGIPVSSYILTFSWSSALPLLLNVDVDLKLQNMLRSLDRWFLTNKVSATEKIYGFGEQYTVGDVRGKMMEILTQEQGIGRGQQPITDVEDVKPPHLAGGTWQTTYTQIPYYLTNEARGLLVNTTAYSVFDVCVSRPDTISAMMVVPGLEKVGNFVILSGSGSLLGVIEALTSMTGRMQPLPQWISGNGALVGAMGGTDRVNRTWRTLKNAGVPVASMWIQDWPGDFLDTFGMRVAWNWMIDPNLYPHWHEFVAELAQEDVKITLYINPFISTFHPSGTKSLWMEADDLGYLVKDLDGKSYVTNSGSMTLLFSLVDLTNPAACAWFKRIIRCNVLGDQSACPPGVRANAKTWGYMSDFGEYLPYLNVSLYSGEDPMLAHGRWPSMWQALCREAQIEAGRDDEVVFWTRSASLPFTGNTRMWMGDQTTTWDNHDGMASALIGMMNGGLSGLGITHSDIGGFLMMKNPLLAWRTPELLKRWGELSAFADSMFRTHPGSKYLRLDPLEIWSTPDLLDSFTRSARIHMALWPYREQLMQEHNRNGAPLVRHMFLHFPEDMECWNTPLQYMLGSEMLVAPALEENATHTMVYLPPAQNWTQLWSGNVFAFGWQNVSTPIGFPAVFLVSPITPMLHGVVHALRQL